MRNILKIGINSLKNKIPFILRHFFAENYQGFGIKPTFILYMHEKRKLQTYN